MDLLKLGSLGGYAHSTFPHTGTTPKRAGRISGSTVTNPTDGLLGEGRHLYTVNAYTSVVFAKGLLRKKTLMNSWITSWRTGSQWPYRVKSRNEKVLRLNGNRDVVIISTAHGFTIDPTTRKYEVVYSYSKYKLPVNVMDQTAAYPNHTPGRHVSGSAFRFDIASQYLVSQFRYIRLSST
ncbi:hypothetical protein KIN20_017441 [Parelaphostrongylus tenuis]|uniref:Uncharacterized protein n=1 Tax=Parelaphostrongylus tenuis TaxID=148309 RepID=A0AAD5QRI4_PARTN|nr:hypothetical protein KIN20_017441 [Parelaphostrongylus tenuis]